ncbi:MAG: DUF2007 domain-containing protein [Bacillota bacterium]|nr:DUF2007 domain-containing protein [Bacillota bacterium]
MNSDNWVKVFSSSKAYLVEIAQGVLEEEGIESVIINQIDSAYLFGECELYVKNEDAFNALQIISKIESE